VFKATLGLFALALAVSGATCTAPSQGPERTVVSIEGDKFLIDGKPTYEGVSWNGHPIEGLLFNSRMVQGIFDDLNPEFVDRWRYPDTGEWDADRNTDEFVAAMPSWYESGLRGFTLNLQGGSPLGYGNRPWINSTFDEHGDMRPEYLDRLSRILDRADELEMVVILGLFYFGQDQNLADEAAVVRAVDNAVGWLFENGYRNVLIEVNNEADVDAYDHAILEPDRVHELILRVRENENGYRFLAGTSFGGGTVPPPNVVGASDFILIHGNGVDDPARITEMVEETRRVEGYRPMPIVFNEDDHYDFDQASNNMLAATYAYASWGFFDYRREGEPFEDGFQSVPVDWRIGSERKRAFFNLVRRITSGN
jgi:hypothetical protein